MASSANPLNPEAKPWEPKLAIKAPCSSIKNEHQIYSYSYYYYSYSYPLFYPNHNLIYFHSPPHSDDPKGAAAEPAAAVFHYKVENQPDGGNGITSVGNKPLAGKVIDGGECREVVTYKCPVGPGRGVGWGSRFMKGKGRIVPYSNKSCGWGGAKRFTSFDGRLGRRSTQWVPSSSSKKILFSGGEVGSGDRTTVMIRNIPNQFSREMFLCFLDGYCSEFNLEYDFVYLPMDFKSLDNLGYAFVNFTSASAAAKIREVLSNYQWGLIRVSKGFVESKKTCQVSWARLQGKKELIRNFKNSNFCCYTCDYLPVIIDPPRNGSNSTSTTATPIGKCRQLLVAPKAISCQ